MAHRGLPTLELRIKEIEKNALNMANQLIKHKKIYKVYHPALKSHKNHKIWKRDFTGSSGLFSFELDKKYSNDGLHISGEGYLLWKQIVNNYIHDI